MRPVTGGFHASALAPFNSGDIRIDNGVPLRDSAPARRHHTDAMSDQDDPSGNVANISLGDQNNHFASQESSFPQSQPSDSVANISNGIPANLESYFQALHSEFQNTRRGESGMAGSVRTLGSNLSSQPGFHGSNNLRASEHSEIYSGLPQNLAQGNNLMSEGPISSPNHHTQVSGHGRGYETTKISSGLPSTRPLGADLPPSDTPSPARDHARVQGLDNVNGPVPGYNKYRLFRMISVQIVLLNFQVRGRRVIMALD